MVVKITTIPACSKRSFTSLTWSYLAPQLTWRLFHHIDACVVWDITPCNIIKCISIYNIFGTQNCKTPSTVNAATAVILCPRSSKFLPWLHTHSSWYCLCNLTSFHQPKLIAPFCIVNCLPSTEHDIAYFFEEQSVWCSYVLGHVISISSIQ